MIILRSMTLSEETDYYYNVATQLDSLTEAIPLYEKLHRDGPHRWAPQYRIMAWRIQNIL